MVLIEGLIHIPEFAAGGAGTELGFFAFEVFTRAPPSVVGLLK